MGCTLAFAMQITSIIAGALYVILAFVDLIKFWGFVSLFANVFAIILGFTCIIIEIYVFDFFKYFAFLFTNWGRSAFYLFLAVNIFRNNVIGYIGFAVFLALFIFYLVVFIVCRDQKMACPLAQPSGPRFETSSSNFS